MILLDTGMRKMPDKCSLCNFFRVESQMYCTAVVGYTTVSKPYERRPVWCPLHEVTDSDTISRRQAIDALFEILDRPKHAEFLYTDEIARALNQLPPSPSIKPDPDTISRQAAYDTLTEYYHHKTDMQHTALAEALNRVPSTSRPRWIPVTERLPEECGNYLVSGGGNLWLCEWIGSGWVNSVRNPVIESWMSLPEPYYRP